MNFAASRDYCGDGRIPQRSIVMCNIDTLTFQPEDEVLDVGCGSGEETKMIASKVKSVTGVDASEEMIAVATQTNSAPNIEYVVRDARSVGDNPDWQGRFDKVVSFFVLHWISPEEQPEALRSILTCLKKGGEGLFIIDNESDCDFPSEAKLYLENHAKWGVYIKDYRQPLYIWAHSLAETVQLLKKCGCSDVQCEIKAEDVSMSERQTKLFFKTNLGQMSLIPADEHGAFLNDMWQWALSRFPDRSRQSGYVRPCGDSMVIHVRK